MKSNLNPCFLKTKALRFFWVVILVVVFSMIPSIAYSQSPGSKPIDQAQKIENISTFARLYGYVKYFYPGDEAEAMAWDGFAVYGVKQVENAANPSELKAILTRLFSPVAPALQIYSSQEKAVFSKAKITPPNVKDMNIIAWQHQGLGIPKGQNTYKSARLNRKPIAIDGFGAITNSIDAKSLQEKEVKLRAALRVKEGAGQLWLRVDLKNRQHGFFDNMDNRVVTSDEWNYYEIVGSVAKDADVIYYGCFLNGEGQLWVDDFQIYFKGKEDVEWQPLETKNPGFEDDQIGAAPKDWLDNGSYMRQYTFKVSDETAANGNRSLKIDFKSLAVSEELFAEKPQIGEYIDKKLGCGLSCIMPIALYGTAEYTFPRSNVKELTALKTSLQNELPKELSGNDPYVRLANIVIAWNAFQHFFPYFDVIGTDWLSMLPKGIEWTYSDKTSLDFLKTLRRWTAFLRDGHVNVNLKGDVSELFYLPLAWDVVEDRLVILSVYDKSLDLSPGDVVEAIDGQNAMEVYRGEAQYISAATQGWQQWRAVRNMLSGAENAETNLKVKRGFQSRHVTVKHSFSMGQFWQLYRKNDVLYKEIEPGIFYLNLDQIPMTEINVLLPRLKEAKGIICDLRGYPKGDNSRLISYLLKEKENARWMFTPRIIYPDYEKVTFRESSWGMEPVQPHLDAKIVFITDGRAISYAESYMGYIQHHRLATIVGANTAGTNGNANVLRLPGVYSITWTGMKVLKHDGSQYHGVGVAPDIPVKMTIKGIQEGRDEFLEKALEVIKQN